MEIERKFLVKKENLPENLEQYPCKVIEQGYLCTEPVVRIRKSNDNYYLTYKSKGLLAREEYNLPLTKEAYEHLKLKADGIVISKVRYVIPEKEINEFAETATVEFEDGRFADYSFKQLEELELAYAITIHKSQGSEYPAVILPLLSGPKMLMNRNLLYTGVTRARKCVTVVGSEETFGEMIRNEKQQKRYSSLGTRIRELSEPAVSQTVSPVSQDS